MADALRIGALWTLLAVALALTALLRRRGTLSPEGARKLLHCGMGLPLLFLPQLFRHPAPVWILLAGAGIALAWIRRGRLNLGAGLYAVGRDSFGEFAYLLGVGLLWTFSRDRPAFHVPPLLVLMFADAAAALVGTRYGKRRYRTTAGEKSWEGSAAFLAVTFALVLCALRALSPQSMAHDLLSAATIALLVMMMEGASWQGWDNLFVPLAVLGMLRIYDPLRPDELALRLGVALALFALLQLGKRGTLLHQGGALGAVLAGYFAYAFGGPAWLAPPLLFYALYSFSTSGVVQPERQTHGLFAVLAVAGAPLAWAVWFWHSADPNAFPAAQAAYAAQGACTLIARPRLGRGAWAGFSMTVGALIPGILPALGVMPLRAVPLLFAGAAASALLFRTWQLDNPHPGTERDRWLRHALLGAAASLLTWAIM